MAAPRHVGASRSSAAAAHGAWKRADRRARRRTTAGSPRSTAVQASTGPAAGDARLRTTADPTGRTVLGTLNNCAGGMTPWGTVLSGEENFNQYFDSRGALDPALRGVATRATASPARGTRGWSEVDPRFDLTTEPHEPFRFGWIVEVDPYDPRVDPAQAHHAGPVQARGRQHHRSPTAATRSPTWATTSAATTSTSSSRPTSSTRATRRPRSRATCSCSTRGTLYVAQLTGDGTARRRYDGTGEWIPLTQRHRRRSSPGMSRRRRAHRHPAGRRQGRARPRWTAPRTSSPTRSTARSTRR